MRKCCRCVLVKIIFFIFLVGLAGCIPASRGNFHQTPQPVLVTSNITGWAIYSEFVDHEAFMTQIFLKNIDTGKIAQLTNSGNNGHPSWSPDGSEILFLSSTAENHNDIFLMNNDGSDQRPLVASFANEWMAKWSPDGHTIVFVSDKDGNDEIYTINLKTQNIVRLTFTAENESFPQWSSDGNHIAFSAASEESSGRMQIFVMDADGTNKKQVTTYHQDNFDKNPVWCPDGSCIVFTRLSGPAQLMLLDLNTMDVTPLFDDIFKPEGNENANEGNPSRSPVRGYITFSIQGMFYALDMKSREIYPLGVQALNLSLYP